MRPVRLELDGFGSFRQPSTVDFTDADFFALVGPTGAGKSTVVDAIVFALYGSVPRWEDRRAVGWALAPTATRGVVTLTFDVGPDRYVATRELRRSAQGKVTVRNARLERGETVLAADGEVSGAVEKLLGLSYDHFVRCVILPQGDFARFLHSSPKERQDTLVDLLGIRVYREIAKAANAEALGARSRAEIATGQLAGYADATEEAERAATERADALAKLATVVAQRVPGLAEATAALAEAEAEVRRLDRDRGLLAALRVPAGLDELAEQSRTAAAGLALAEDALATAEKADTAAREAREAAGERAALERLRDAWAELGDVTAALPAALSRRAAEEAAVRRVEAAGAAAREAVERARADLDAVRRGNMAVALRAHLVAGEPCPVCAQPVRPAGGAAVPAEGVIPGLDVPAPGPAPAARRGRARAAGPPEPAGADRAGADRTSADRVSAEPPGAESAGAELAAAEQAVRSGEAEVTRLQQAWQAANRALQTAGGRAEALTARQDSLLAQLDGRPDQAEVAAALAGIEQAERDLRAADRALREARRARDAAVRAERDAAARLAAARADLDAARDPLVPLGAPPPERADLVADWLALAEWALAAAEERAARAAEAGAARTAAGERLAGREQELRGELAAHGVEVDARRPLAEAAEPAVAAAESRARATAARIAERRVEAAALRATVAAAEDEAAVAKLLGQLLRADGFERWLLGSALDVLVADASETLLELSGGQFELTHDGRDFAVVDHADADSVRPVRTLSGGETFQASLALALALSAQLAGLAAGGTARLDAIVLDEGFGTLDEATLDVVASTLESLAAGGDRMVGVVTHVGALAERVPVRFAVSRTAAGSTVERQDR
jgi:exonuclease SbcC